MGCGESRFLGNSNQSENFFTLNTSFVPGASDNGAAMLSPLDKFEQTFKESLPEVTYGAWEKKQIELTDSLQIDDSVEHVKEFAETCQKQTLVALKALSVFLTAKGIIKSDDKTQYIGKKYLPEDVTKQIDAAIKAIESRVKKPGVV